MIRERIIEIWNMENLTAKRLEQMTGIDREKWYSLRNGKRRANEDDIEAMVAVTPRYALWMVSGKIAPEVGQVSPDYEAATADSIQKA